MLTKIRERAVDTQLRQEFLCGDANFRTLAEAIPCAMFISQGKRLHYVNHAAEAITGYAREELLSMNLTLSFSLVEEFSVLGEVPVRCDSKHLSQNGPSGSM